MGGWVFTHGANTDTFGEAIVGLNVVVELLHCLLSQKGAVVGLIHVHYHCKIAFFMCIYTLGLQDRRLINICCIGTEEILTVCHCE